MALAQEDSEQIQPLSNQANAGRPETLNANVRYEWDWREHSINGNGCKKASSKSTNALHKFPRILTRCIKKSWGCTMK